MRRVLRIQNEEATRALADLLDEPLVAGALVERLDAVERIADARACVARRLRPFVNHGGREVEVGGDFLGRFLVEDFAEQFVGLHDATMRKRRNFGKREARKERGVHAAFSSRAGGTFGEATVRDFGQ